MLSPRCNCPEIDNVSSRSELVFPVTKSDFPVRRAAGARPCPSAVPAGRQPRARCTGAALRSARCSVPRPVAGATPVQRAGGWHHPGAPGAARSRRTRLHRECTSAPGSSLLYLATHLPEATESSLPTPAAPPHRRSVTARAEAEYTTGARWTRSNTLRSGWMPPTIQRPMEQLQPTGTPLASPTRAEARTSTTLRINSQGTTRIS